MCDTPCCFWSGEGHTLLDTCAPLLPFSPGFSYPGPLPVTGISPSPGLRAPPAGFGTGSAWAHVRLRSWLYCLPASLLRHSPGGCTRCSGQQQAPTPGRLPGLLSSLCGSSIISSSSSSGGMRRIHLHCLFRRQCRVIRGTGEALPCPVLAAQGAGVPHTEVARGRYRAPGMR